MEGLGDRAVTERSAWKGRIALRIPFPERQAFWSSPSTVGDHSNFTCTVSSGVSRRKQALNGWTVSRHCRPQRTGRKQPIRVQAHGFGAHPHCTEVALGLGLTSLS